MTERESLRLIERFNEAWNAHDLSAAPVLVTDDCVFESTGPAPDGERSKASLSTLSLLPRC